LAGGGGSADAAAAGRTCTPQRGCIRRHLANRNEMRVSGSDSYALFLFILEGQLRPPGAFFMRDSIICYSV